MCTRRAWLQVYWLFALLSAAVCVSLGLFLFPFFSVLRLWYVAPSHLSRGFFTLGAFYFLLQHFGPFFSLLLCTMWLNFVSLPGDQPIGRMAFTLLPVLFFFLFLILCNKAPLSTLALYFSCTPLCTTHISVFPQVCYPTLSVNWGLPLCLQAVIVRSNVPALLKRLLWPGWLLTGLEILVTAQTTSGTTDAHTLCLLSHLQRLSALVRIISYDHYEIPCLCRTSAEIGPM